MRSSIKALITAVILEAATLSCIGIGYAIGDWNYKIRRADHFLIDLGQVAHIPGSFCAWLVGIDNPHTIAAWSIAIMGNLGCGFIFWLIIYEGLAGLRARRRTSTFAPTK